MLLKSIFTPTLALVLLGCNFSDSSRIEGECDKSRNEKKNEGPYVLIGKTILDNRELSCLLLEAMNSNDRNDLDWNLVKSHLTAVVHVGGLDVQPVGSKDSADEE